MLESPLQKAPSTESGVRWSLRLEAPDPKRVRWYPEGAQLERVLPIDLPAGITELHLTGFHEGVDLARLHVSAQDALVLSVDVLGQGPTSSGQAPIESRAEIEGLIAGAVQTLEFLDGLRSPLSGEAFAPGAYWKAQQFLERTRSDLEAKLQGLRAQRPLDSDPDLASCRSFDPTLILRLRRVASGISNVRILTEISQATWRSEYELRIDGAMVHLERSADIYHKLGPCTAEAIELWASKPKTDLIRPSWAPWVVSSERPYEEQSASLYADRNRDATVPQPEKQVIATQLPSIYRSLPAPVEQAALALPGPHRLDPSEPLCLRIPSPSFKTDWVYLVRPALDPRAYASLTLTPKHGAFDGGQVHLFLQGTFRRARIEGVCTQKAPWHFEFGPLPSLVAHRSVEVSLDPDRLLQRGDLHRIQVQLKVESRIDSQCKVVIEDQVPLCSDPRIRVRFKGAGGDHRGSPSASLPDQQIETTYSNTSGFVQLNFMLEPNGHRELYFRYEIESPRDYHLVQSLVS